MIKKLTSMAALTVL